MIARKKVLPQQDYDSILRCFVSLPSSIIGIVSYQGDYKTDMDEVRSRLQELDSLTYHSCILHSVERPLWVAQSALRFGDNKAKSAKLNLVDHYERDFLTQASLPSDLKHTLAKYVRKKAGVVGHPSLNTFEHNSVQPMPPEAEKLIAQCYAHLIKPSSERA